MSMEFRRNGRIVRDTGDSDMYLGNPEVVEKLIRDFVNKTYEMIKARGDGSMTSEEMTHLLGNLINSHADIVMGRNSLYTTLIYQSRFGLGIAIRQVLGQYWELHKEENNNDPGRVLFLWLSASVLKAAMEALKDPDAAGAEILHKKADVIRLILGLQKRAR